MKRQAAVVVLLAALAVYTASALRQPEATVVALPSTTTTTAKPTTTTRPPATTSNAAPVDRRAEVAAIHHDAWFRWFDGVYRQDAEVIDSVAGVNALVGWAADAHDIVAWTDAPTRDNVKVTLQRVLLDRPDCLVVSSILDITEFVDSAGPYQVVDVLFPVGDSWGFAAFYMYEREMWQVDCDYLQRR
jgi:hypothetical protein